MPEQIHKLQDQVDNLDQSKDRKVSIGGMEEDLTKTYIKKMDDLLAKMDKVDPAETELARQSIVEELKATDAQNIVDRWASFDISLETDISILEDKIAIREKIDRLDSAAWNGVGGWSLSYENLRVNNYIENTSLETVANLANYISKAPEIAERFAENTSFFMEGTAQTTENNPVLKMFLGETIVKNILSGEIANPDKLLQTFEEATKETEEKRKACEEFMKTLRNAGEYVATEAPILQPDTDQPQEEIENPEQYMTPEQIGEYQKGVPYQKILSRPRQVARNINIPKEQMIDLFVVLVEGKKLDPDATAQTLSELVKHEEIRALFAENKQGGTEFLMKEIPKLQGLSEKDRQKETCKARARLFAESILSKEKAETKKQLEERAKELQETQKELEQYKEQFLRNGVLYANMEVMESTDTVEHLITMPETGEKISTGNFRRLVKMEEDAKTQEVSLLASQISLSRNKATSSMISSHIDKTLDRIFAEGAPNPEKNLQAIEAFIESSLSKMEDESNQARFTRLQEAFNTAASFAETERLQAIYFVRQQEASVVISNNDQASEKELTCRKALEGSAKQGYMDEDQKAYVIEKKGARVRTLYEENSKLEELITENYTEIKASIDKYGSVYLMPENEKALAKEKTTTLVATIGTSLDFTNQLKFLDAEIRVIDPNQGLKDDVLTHLRTSEITNKELLKGVTKFLGNEVDLTQTETQILTPEITGLMLNSLNEKAGPLVDSAMDNYGKKGEQIGIYFKAVQQRAEEAEMVEEGTMPERQTREYFEKATGTGRFDILEEGKTKLSELASAFENGKAKLLQAKGILQSELDKEEGVFKENPKLLEIRREMIKNIIENIDKTLEAVFSDTNKKQIDDQITAIETQKKEMFWSIVKTGLILAATVALAMATGGIAAAGVGRLCTFIGGRALQYMGTTQFVVGNIAVAAGSTIGQRAATEGINATVRGFGEVGVNLGQEYNVDWDFGVYKDPETGEIWAGSGLTDFGKSLAMSVAFTGVGKFVGSKIARIKTSSSMTYGELSEMGLTRMGFLENMANPFKIFGKGSTTGLRGIGREFAEEFGEESTQEFGDSVSPVLGGLLALISSSKIGDVNADIDARTTPAPASAELGIEFNPATGRYEFAQANAKDFGTELLQKLGPSHNAVGIGINPDGSITIKQAGTENGITIYPKEGVQTDPNSMPGNLVTTENLANSQITLETRESALKLLTGTDENLRILTESLINVGDTKALTLLGKAHRSGDQVALKQVTDIMTGNANIESYKEYGKDGIIGVAKKLNPGNKQAAMEDATFLLDKLIRGNETGFTINDILPVDKELDTGAAEFKGDTELTPEILRARMARTDVETLRAGINKAKTAEDVESLIAEIRSPAEQQMLSQAWKSLHEFDLEEDALEFEHTQAIFKESAGYLNDYLSAIEAGGFKGGKEITPQELFSIIEGNQRKLAYQTIVDERHITGSDHGTMHILNGDMEHSLRIADQLGLTPQERIILRQAIIDHDMGYAQSTARYKQGDQFFGMTKDHPLYSTLMLEANREAYVKAFGQEGYDAIRTTVLNHSDTRGIDPANRPGLELVRDIAAIVDALQVTSDLKMMGLFRQPQFMAEMQKMDFIWKRVGRGEITKAEGIQLIQGIKDKMLRMIDQGPFSTKLKQAYKEAIENNLDPVNTQFMINRDFGAHVGGFEGIDIDTAGRMVAKFDVYDSQALIAGIFGNKTATASLTKAMGEFGLKEGQPVSINGETVTFDSKDFSSRLKGLKMGETIVVETKKGRFEFTKRPENSENMKEFTSTVRRTHEVGEFIEKLRNTEDMPQAEISARLEQTREALSQYTVNGQKASDLLAPFHRARRRGEKIDQKALKATLENIYYNGNIATPQNT